MGNPATVATASLPSTALTATGTLDGATQTAATRYSKPSAHSRSMSAFVAATARSVWSM